MTCQHCNEPKEKHRGIDLYCGDQFATSWNPLPPKETDFNAILDRLIKATDRMAEEIEKIKAHL
jgi:mRNA degradation ribonuclease J1/J2